MQKKKKEREKTFYYFGKNKKRIVFKWMKRKGRKGQTYNNTKNQRHENMKLWEKTNIFSGQEQEEKIVKSEWKDRTGRWKNTKRQKIKDYKI